MSGIEQLWPVLIGISLLARFGGRIFNALHRLIDRFRARRGSNLSISSATNPGAPSTGMELEGSPTLTASIAPAPLPPIHESWSNPALPTFARWICVYGLIVNPALWVLDIIDTLFNGIYDGYPLNALSALSVVSNALSLFFVSVMIWGVLRLRRMQASGRNWIMFAIIGNTVTQVLCVGAYFLIDHPSAQERGGWFVVKNLVMILLSLSAFIFEIGVLIWFTKRREQLVDLCADSTASPAPALPIGRRARRMVVTIIVILAVCCVIRTVRTSGIATDGTTTPLTAQQLPLAAQFIRTDWTVNRSIIADRTEGILGSSGVLGLQGDELVLVTNAHVLGLEKVADTGLLDNGIGSYQITVTFPSGVQAMCTKMAVADGGVDLALLTVSAGGLQQGRDYEILPNGSALQLNQGDDVVALGAPEGLTGTATYGHISTFRAMGLSDGKSESVIQTDAAINPGNSGGPLFVRRDDRLWWIGIDTWKLDGSGLGFAIHAGEVGKARYRWYAVNPAGAAQAIQDQSIK